MITVIALTGGVTSGRGVLVGNLFGVAATTAAEGENVDIATVGIYGLPKLVSAVIAASALDPPHSAFSLSRHAIGCGMPRGALSIWGVVDLNAGGVQGYVGSASKLFFMNFPSLSNRNVKRPSVRAA